MKLKKCHYCGKPTHIYRCGISTCIFHARDWDNLKKKNIIFMYDDRGNKK